MKVFAFLLLVSVFFFSPLFLFSKNVGGQEDTTGPVISDISASASDSSATIAWTTDEPATSGVEWGTTPDMELNTDDATLVTSHSVTISSLSASTLYYYAIFTHDAGGWETVSGTNTFTTTASSPEATAQPTTDTTTTTTTSVKKDTTAPIVSLSTNLSRPYVSSPTISGTVSDDGGVAAIEYSVDGGVNWTAASVEEEEEGEATFSFFLGVLDDGNYSFLMRAKDSAGNTSESKEYTLIVDRLPPQVGTTIISFGPQLLAPTKEGFLVTAVGLEQKITLSAIGGPITLDISSEIKSPASAETSAGRQNSKLFKLERNPESGLWSGNLKFDEPGAYELTATSIDGAKNKTVQSLVKVLVLEAGKISYQGKQAKNALISVYVFEPILGQFILWDGATYGVPNPQTTNENGGYSFLLPSGKYYLEVKLLGVIKVRTQIFELSTASIINPNISSSWPIPFIANEIKVNLEKDLPTDLKPAKELVGSDFPDDAGLEKDKGQVVTILNTWLPDTSTQIKILEDLPDKVKASVLVPQESTPTVEVFKKRGRYSFDFLADPDGKLVEPLALRFLPVHFFLDKDGEIKSVNYGVLNREEIINLVTN